jgi:hypothetical protein
MYQPPSHQPLYTQEDMQRRQDDEHLNLLAIFYYVYAGLSGLGVLYGLLYAVMGAAMGRIPLQPGRPGGETFPTAFFTVFGIAIMVLSGIGIWLNIATASALKARKNTLLIQINAALHCLSIPIGTVLGIFTFVVLARPSIKALFDGYTYHPKEQSPYDR